ncbi:MAG: cysteine-rich CWC family protein [Burkholderiales bacterium]
MNSTPRSTAEAAAPDRCPRCGGGFQCGAASGYCACFELKLSEPLKAQLAQQFTGCLCMNCLREMATTEQDDQ